MANEIDDIEFEQCLERVIELWDEGVDTFDMSKMLGITEAKAAYILSCYIEGSFICKEEESYAPNA